MSNLVRQQFEEIRKQKMSKYVGKMTAEDVYGVLQSTIQVLNRATKKEKEGKKLYYISAEFLLGKMLTSNLINAGVWEDAKSFAQEMGYDWKTIQAVEKEPSLGNGGLGRLAACFLDSIASLQLPGDGIGLYYHFGLFEQRFENRKQKEIPNAWIDDSSWFRKKDVSYCVPFPQVTLQPVCYEMDVMGSNGYCNTLHLFDVKTVDESIVKNGIHFDKTDIAKNLTLFLYPDDSDDDGRRLRIYQQYFMVSCGAQMILEDCKAKGYDLYDLDAYVVVQINDTHPTMIILEFIRLLMLEGMHMKDAIRIVQRMCAYTNHTILAEALETWPMEYMRSVVPQLCDIIEALDVLVDSRTQDEKTAIIDKDHRVHMAHIDIHFGKSVNGVAELHTQILKQSELKSFYEMYPERFNNKTNGITFRRWLHAANETLYTFLCETCKDDVIANPSALKNLLKYKKDKKTLQALLDIKKQKKQMWVSHMKEKQGIDIPVDAIFDTQVKRLHEYKRQQMNALYIIYKYLEIKAGKIPKRPIVCIFGAKAAPAYVIAKDIIHVLLCLQDVIASDKAVAPYLQVCFIENYNVTEAEFIVPATDISEQISLASKEASGTGNMKFMLNGALTLGTMDGANVEIAEAVGKNNIFVFGKDSKTVIEHYAKGDYKAKTYYEESEVIQKTVDFIICDEMKALGDAVSLKRVYDELLNKDWFMTLLDVEEYIACKDQMLEAYEDRFAWAEMMLVNIANSGFFSSDRTIREYNEDIWHLQ